jgi:hypothetical protein
MKSILHAVIPGAVFSVLFVTPALAYLDPGTGSILLQGLFAAVVGGLVTIKLYWAKVKTLFGSKTDKSSSAQDGSS